MRKKEAAQDYRYFHEPDLPPIVIKQEYIDQLRKELPELPKERYERYTSKYNLTEYAASILISEKAISDFFEEALKFTSNARSLCNWITVEFIGKLKEKGETLFSLNIQPEHIGKLVAMIDKKIITGKIAKKVADDMIETQKDPEEIVKNNPDYQPIDDSLIEPLVDQVIKQNPQSIEDFKAGRQKAFAFLVGQVMKLCKGKANPEVVTSLIRKKIELN
jgi:aspartyl-tRNA(Asn)/glutamyl-tRNA(Gln) amidotransferase subunit B